MRTARAHPTVAAIPVSEIKRLNRESEDPGVAATR